MIDTIKNWFLKPYPFVTTLRQKILLSLIFGKIMFLFFYIFKPYAIHNLESGLVRNALIFGLITFMLTLISFIIIPLISPKYFNPLKWTIGRMSLFYLYLSLLLSSVYWYYTSFFLALERQLSHDFFYYFFSSLITSFSAFMFYIFLNERKKNHHFSSIAKKLMQSKSEICLPGTESFSFKSDINNENNTLLISDLVYIKTQKNKAIIFYRVNDLIQEKTFSLSNNELEIQIKEHVCLIRCHPSYIINSHKVSKIIGNVRGYFLQVADVDFLIPVSHNFPKEFLYTLIK